MKDKQRITLVLSNEDVETIRMIQENLKIFSLNQVMRTLLYSTDNINSLYIKSIEFKNQ